WSNKRGDNFEFLGNQFVQLSFAWPEGNTTDIYNTTITSQLFDLDAQGLPDPTRRFTESTLYSWDGRGALNKIQDFEGRAYSYTPVPAREGSESWSVVLADYGKSDIGLFGLGGFPKAAYWQSSKPAKVSAMGPPADLSTRDIVGIAVGTVAFVVIASFAVRHWRHRLKNKKRDIELSKIGSGK
ncbi:hypothetical protein BGZ92_006694, partial [Podila epicladia]